MVIKLSMKYAWEELGMRGAIIGVLVVYLSTIGSLELSNRGIINFWKPLLGEMMNEVQVQINVTIWTIGIFLGIVVVYIFFMPAIIYLKQQNKIELITNQLHGLQDNIMREYMIKESSLRSEYKVLENNALRNDDAADVSQLRTELKIKLDDLKEQYTFEIFHFEE
jgi:ABC-type uncharacterized transport system fused permease/ATPase subunit